MKFSIIKNKVKFIIFSPSKFVKKYLTVFKELVFFRGGDNTKVSQFYIEEKEKFDKELNVRSPKVLAIVNHYYNNKNSEFPGKSSTQKIETRKKIVNKVIDELKKIPNVDVVVCGIKGHSLVDIDKDFSAIENSAFLVYSSIEWMFNQIDKYDYFINIEEDILLTKETFENIVEFDKSHSVVECLHPNRMEYENGVEYCADFKAMYGWKNISMEYLGDELRVAKNPHSGLVILSKPKMLYARDNVDLKKRDIIIGYYMASAYANVNSPFLLYRAYSDIYKHKVVHLDNWEER